MRRLMWMLIGFAISCAVGAWLLRGGMLLIPAGIGLLGAGILFLAGKKLPWLRAGAAVCLGVMLGSVWFARFEQTRLIPAAALDRTERVITVTAQDFGAETERGMAVRGTAELEGNRFRVQLYLNEVLPVRPGDRIRTEARLRCTDVGRTSYHRGNGILLTAYQKGNAELLTGDPGAFSAAALRQAGLREIDRAFPADAAAFARALVFGDKSDLSYRTMTDFKVTGVSHMVAVSGLHLSILFAVVYVLAGKGRYLTAVLGIPCAMLFAAAVGFTPSVTRAAIMLSLMMLALALNREYDPPTGLAFAALAMLMHNPLVITSVGFEMSVGSVAGIFLFYGPIRSWFADRLPKPKKHRWNPLHAAAASVSVTLSATVFSAPLAAIYFGNFSLVSIPANLLILPVISVVFCGILGTCLLSALLPAAGAVLGWLVAWPIRYVLGVARLLAGLPLASVYTASPYIRFWLVFLGILLVCLMVSRRRRPVLASILAVLGLTAALGCAWMEPLTDDYRVTALDVGQGQCVILQSGANTVLVDCGGDYEEQAADLAAETLLGMGISRIDGLIVSHYDRDHCGGAEYLADRIAIDRAFLPVPREPSALSERVAAGLRDSEIIWMDSDLELRLGDAEIRIFVPQNAKSDNESCAAVLFTRGKYDTLIPGDLPGSREQKLLETYDLPDLEVLVAGHHGSKTSTIEALLRQTAPDVVMISCGQNNPYGHPAREVLQRLEEAGCAVLRTDRMGTVTYRR